MFMRIKVVFLLVLLFDGIQEVSGSITPISVKKL